MTAPRLGEDRKLLLGQSWGVARRAGAPSSLAPMFVHRAQDADWSPLPAWLRPGYPELLFRLL